MQRFAPEKVTKGGIHVPEKSLGKVLNATVVAVGKGLKQKVRQFFLFIIDFCICRVHFSLTRMVHLFQ